MLKFRWQLPIADRIRYYGNPGNEGAYQPNYNAPKGRSGGNQTGNNNGQGNESDPSVGGYDTSSSGFQQSLDNLQSRPSGTYTDPKGNVWIVDQYGKELSLASAANSGNPYGGGLGGASTAMTQYEQAQIDLEKQKEADLKAQQDAANKLAASTLIENANAAFRKDAQTDHYGAANGMTWQSPKGSAMPQRVQETSAQMDAYKLTGQADPWQTSSTPATSGYTGQAYAGAQQPNLRGPFDESPIPTSGVGSQIPIPAGGLNPGNPGGQSVIPGGQSSGPTAAPNETGPGRIPHMASGGQVPGYTGQPQLIQAHGGEEVIPASGQPAPTTQGPVNQGSGMHPAIQSLLAAAHAFISHPDFAQPESQAPSMAMGGMVPDVGATSVRGGGSEGPLPSQSPGGFIQGRPQSMGGGMPQPPRGIQGEGPTPTPIENGGNAGGSDWQSNFNNWKPIGGQPDGRPSQSPPPAPSGGVPPGVIYSGGPASQPWHPTLGGPHPEPPLPGGPTVAPNETGPGRSWQPQPAQQPTTMINPARQTILNGPGVVNHPQYGAELTGLSGLGATMTPDGTPVAMSGWQMGNLDPSSIAAYQNYTSSIAGFDPADMKQMGTSTTMPLGMTGFTPPRTWTPPVWANGPGGG